MANSAESVSVRRALSIPVRNMHSSDRRRLWRTALLALFTTLTALALGVGAACLFVS